MDSGNPTPTALDILKRAREKRDSDAPFDDQPVLICQLEDARMKDDDRCQLLDHLRWYITQFYDLGNFQKYQHPKDPHLIALGSAIRKYIAMLDVGSVDDIVSPLLDIQDRWSAPIFIELEVVKMVYRKFEANPLDPPISAPKLEAHLSDIAEAYLHPRVLPQPKVAAVASLAVVALAAMRSARAEPVVKRARIAHLRWFREMIVDDLTALLTVWKLRGAESASHWLVSLIDATNPPDFIRKALALQFAGKEDDALDVIYRTCDDLMRAGCFDLLDRALADAPTGDLSLDLQIGVLNATLPAASRLVHRDRFYLMAVRQANDLGQNTRLFGGLAGKPHESG